MYIVYVLLGESNTLVSKNFGIFIKIDKIITGRIWKVITQHLDSFLHKRN